MRVHLHTNSTREKFPLFSSFFSSFFGVVVRRLVCTQINIIGLGNEILTGYERISYFLDQDPKPR